MASNKNQQQSALNKLMQEEIALKEKEKSLQNDLVNMAKARYKISNDAKQTQQDLAASLAESKSTEESIQSIQEAKDKLLQEAISKGKDINSHYFDRLDTQQKILEKLKEEEEAEQRINDFKNAQKGILQEILGIDNEIEEAIVSGGMKVLFLNKAFENVSANVSRMYDGVKSNVTELGLAGGEAMKLQGNIELASMSMTGFLYGSDAVALSAKAITEEYGNVNAATTDLIKGVTEVSSLTGDASTALKLTEAFESAGVEAGDVKDKISDIAKEAGVSGQLAVKGLGDQMHRLVGASEEELELIIKGNIELQKRGMTMGEIEALSNNMLDIETSMRNEAKARAMFGRDIGASEMRSLSLQLQTAKTEEERTRIATQMSDLLMEKVGSSEEFNNMSLKEQEIMAQSYGMSVQDLATKIQTTEKQKELTEKYGEYAGLVEGAQGFLAMGASAVGNMTLEMVKLIAKTAIMNMMMGKGAGFGNLKDGVMGMFGKGGGGAAAGGGGGVPGMDATQDAGGQAGQAAQGSGGGLKSLAEGLREMGDGKVFAGIGAVALAGPAFIVALPSIPFLLFMGKVKLKALEENFTGLAAGLNQMSATFMGSLAVGAFAIAAIPSILSIPFLLFMGLTPLQQLAPNFTSLAVGLNAMASTFMGSLALGAFAVAAGLAIASIPFLIAISLLGIAASAGLSALGVGLTALGTAAASGLPFLGIALIGALGLAMIPFAIALNIVTPAIEAFGGVIVGVMGAIPPIISAIAEGFVTMMGAITPEAIAGLLLLGPALMLASVGMLAFSASLMVGAFASWFGGGLVDQIVLLGMVGPGVRDAGEGLASVADNMSIVTESMSGMGDLVSPMYQLSGALYSISGGLVAVAGAGLLAIPIFGAIAGLASIAPTLMGLGEFFGMGGDSDSSDGGSDSNAELLEEIKGLRSDIKAQPIVLNIDGKAVQKITRVQSRQGTATRGFS